MVPEIYAGGPASTAGDLYALGMIFQEKEQCEMLKLHWINRLCKDTDCLYGDIDYDDDHFLNYLRGPGIFPYQKLADLAEMTAA